MREQGLMQQVRFSALLIVFVLIAGLASGAAAYHLAGDADAARESFARIYIVSRAGGVDAGDVFWAAMQQSVRMALLWFCACAGPVLMALGCAALFFEGFGFAYTSAALIAADGFRGAMLTACVMLPQNLLVWCAYVMMGLLTARSCHMQRRVRPLREKKTARGKYVLLMLGCVAACIPLCMLHMVLTLKLMKLLPWRV